MSRVTIVYGEDFFLDQMRLKALRGSSPGERVVSLDGTETTAQEVLSALQQPAMDGASVVVVLDNGQDIKSGSELKAWVTGSSKAALLVFCRSEKLPAFWSGVDGKKIEKPKIKPKSKELEAWVSKYACSLGLDLTDKQCAYFSENYDNLRLIAGELTKLSLVVQGVVQNDTFSKYVTSQVNVTPWGVAESIAEKNQSKALRLFGILTDREGENALVPTVIMTWNLFEKLVNGYYLASSGVKPEDIAPRLDMNLWRCKTWLLPTANKRSLVEYRASFKTLSDLNADMMRLPRGRKIRFEAALVDLTS